MQNGIEGDGTRTLAREALDHFDFTVADILSSRAAQQWDAPTGDAIPDEKYPTRLPVA